MSQPRIIGYIHVCQKGEWRRSFKMLLDAIRKFGLYERSEQIRLGIVNEEGVIIDDPLLNDPKLSVVYTGLSAEYERPTLLHMRERSLEESDTYYYYLHTKGIRWFGTAKESFIIDWIELMLYWNIELWKKAVEKLERYDTYGCNYLEWGKKETFRSHYSGNFWWAKSEHVKRLPCKIGENYIAPENWILSIHSNNFCVYKSGYQGMGHYSHPFPRERYCTV